MGDFERCFGAGADAVSIIESFSRGVSPDRASYGEAGTYVSGRRDLAELLAWCETDAQPLGFLRKPPGYSEDDFEVNPEGVPHSRFVIFTSYRQAENWDALGLGLAFTRSPDDDGQYVMEMQGQQPPGQGLRQGLQAGAAAGQ